MAARNRANGSVGSRARALQRRTIAVHAVEQLRYARGTLYVSLRTARNLGIWLWKRAVSVALMGITASCKYHRETKD